VERPDAGGDGGGGGEGAQNSTAASLPSPRPQVTIIPGILIPHQTNIGTLLFALRLGKVIPSPSMRMALRHLEQDLQRALDNCIEALLPLQMSSSSSSVQSATEYPAEVHTTYRRLVTAQRDATATFVAWWDTSTTSLIREVMANGHYDMHFFSVSNDMVVSRLKVLLGSLTRSDEEERRE